MATAPSKAARLADHEAKLRRLATEISDIGFISPGSLVRRYTSCGNPNCRCRADPPQLHGPYWQWSRAVGGKTVTRRVSEEHVPLYQDWIANRRRLRQLMADMEDVSRQASEILLDQR